MCEAGMPVARKTRNEHEQDEGSHRTTLENARRGEDARHLRQQERTSRSDNGSKPRRTGW